MKYAALVPNIFYEDSSVGLRLFTDCLGFRVAYRHDEPGDQSFHVIEKDGIKVHIVQNAEFAAKDRPELRLETDDIAAVYGRVREEFSDLLHPKLSEPTLRPWNAKEFGLVDASGVCIVVQEWQ